MLLLPLALRHQLFLPCVPSPGITGILFLLLLVVMMVVILPLALSFAHLTVAKVIAFALVV